MKKLLCCIVVGLVLAGLASPAPADTIVGQYQTITLDGALTDWNSGNIMYPDSQIGDGSPLNSSYSDIYVCNDADYLYVALQFKGSGGASVVNDWYNRMHIDVDMNGDTGFDGGWMTGGYDQTVWYGNSTYSRYTHSGAQTDWNWNWNNTIDYSYSDSVVEYRIARAGLGLTDAGDQCRLEFTTDSGSVTVETWAEQTEANVGTYTFGAIPEPATAGLGALGLLVLLYFRRNR